MELRPDWYTRETNGHDLDRAGIFLWEIAGEGLYVGSAEVLQRGIERYEYNLRHLLAGDAYHGDPSKDFRPVHQALARAYRAQASICATVLENCAPDILAARKADYLDAFRAKAKTGEPQVLNGRHKNSSGVVAGLTGVEFKPDTLALSTG